MGILAGKRGIVMGIANERSIATAVSRTLHREGAQLGFSYLPDTGERKRNEARVRQVTEDLNPAIVAPCDVSSDTDIEAFFAHVHETMGSLDFLVHSIAYAPTEDLKGPTFMASRAGFATAMEISCYSLLAIARAARPYLNKGASI